MWVDHDIEQILKLVPRERAVLRSRWRGEAAVTRVLLAPVQADLDALVRGAVTAARGSLMGLPEAAALALEGFRVRSRLGDVPWLPEVLDAGVLAGGVPGVADPAPGWGYAWVTLRWADGPTLAQAWPRLDADARGDALRAVLATLAALHERGALFGDLKPENVVLQGPVATLIDLDTLREVPAADAPVVTRDLTPRYAAPEQRAQHLSYTASDVWAFGALATRLLTGDEPAAGAPVPAPWRDVLDACLLPDPHQRPTARALLARVGAPAPPSDATVRVPEPPVPGPASPGTAREPALPVVASAPDPLQPTAPRRRPLRTALGLLLGLGLLTAGAAAAALVVESWEQQAACDVAASQRPALMDRLRLFKTDPTLNRDAAVLDRVVADAARQASACPTSAPLAEAHGLALTWDQAWHHARTRTWDGAAWARADALLGRAPTTAEGWVGRLYLDLGACKLHPDPARRSSGCDAVGRDLEEALARMGDDDGWLRVEALWGAVITWVRASARQRKAGNGVGADQLLERASEACRQAWPHLADAPVNGRELAEDCVAVAGRRGDLAGWTAWLAQEARADLADDGRLDDPTLTLAYTTLFPDTCGSLRLDPAGRLPRIARDAPLGGWEDLCQYAGLVAVGCAIEAEARQRGEDVHDWWWGTRRVTARQRARGDVPWAATLAALGAGEQMSVRCGL